MRDLSISTIYDDVEDLRQRVGQLEFKLSRVTALARIYMTRYEKATGGSCDEGDWELVG